MNSWFDVVIMNLVTMYLYHYGNDIATYIGIIMLCNTEVAHITLVLTLL